MDCLYYSVVACAIRKDEYLAANGGDSRDPYLLSLEVLVNSLCGHIGDAEDAAIIVAEKQGRLLDRQLQLAWLRLRTHGTHHVHCSQVQRRVSTLVLKSKSDNIAGLQLADLVVSPIGRSVLGKTAHEDFQIVQRKLLRDSEGSPSDAALVILPKKKGQDPLRSSQP